MAEGLFRHIDVYCERTDFTFWAEPLNAITNGAFFIAAVFVYIFARKMDSHRDKSVLLFLILLVCIGIGSFLFHTFANRLTGMMDVVPIGIAIFAFYGLTLVQIFGLKWWQAGIAFLYFPILIGLFSLPLFAGLGATTMYLPALVMIVIFSFWAVRRELDSAHYLIMAFLGFSLSLLCRVMDDYICTVWPYGTHFFWHIFNALTLYLCMRFYIQARVSKDME